MCVVVYVRVCVLVCEWMFQADPGSVLSDQMLTRVIKVDLDSEMTISAL